MQALLEANMHPDMLCLLVLATVESDSCQTYARLLENILAYEKEWKEDLGLCRLINTLNPTTPISEVKKLLLA